jgi:hypothetical protein
MVSGPNLAENFEVEQRAIMNNGRNEWHRAFRVSQRMKAFLVSRRREANSQSWDLCPSLQCSS